MSEVVEIITWYGVVWVVGMAVLPTVGAIWKNSFDGGYGMARIAGVALVGYVTLVLGTLRIVHFGTIGLWGIVSFLGIVSWKRKVEWKKWMLIEELIFVIVFGMFVYLRGMNPDIVWGSSEKMMDFMLIKSALNTNYFPPVDSWMAGQTINYYYFGHMVWAALIKMTNVTPEVGYNLAVATLAAVAATGIFGVTGNLIWLGGIKNKRWILTGGILSILMLLGGGNLQTVYSLIKSGVKNYNYWDGVRVIPGTLNEFPAYSFLVGDLHSHVNDLPFVLLGLGIMTIVYTRKEYQIKFSVMMGFLLAIYYMTSAPDAYIYAGLFSLVIGVKTITEKGGIIKMLIRILAMLGVGVTLSLPFAIYFKPFGLGIGFVKERSSIFLLFLLWGWIAYLFSGLGIVKRGVVSIWLVACVLFVLIPEIVYMKDIYGGSFERANTVFKFGYQTSILGAAVCGYMFVGVLNSHKKWLKGIWLVGFAFGAISIMTYPYFMIRSLYGSRPAVWSLNGIAFMKNNYQGDYNAIKWIEKNLPKEAVIVETVGESYTESGRISTHTGRATILGWPVHEWLWRGSYDVVAPRIEEVKLVYESSDIDLTRRILDKYAVKYIVVGNLERHNYPNLQMKKIEDLGGFVFRDGSTAVIHIQR